MRIAIIVTALMISACTSVPQAKFDAQCDKVAVFAKGMAELKLANIMESDVESFILIPKVQTFPIRLVAHQVYGSDMEPQAVYKLYYEKCTLIGYTNLLSFMKDEDNFVIAKQQIQSLQAENNALKNHSK